jgi:hypothetical protein
MAISLSRSLCSPAARASEEGALALPGRHRCWTEDHEVTGYFLSLGKRFGLSWFHSYEVGKLGEYLRSFRSTINECFS